VSEQTPTRREQVAEEIRSEQKKKDQKIIDIGERMEALVKSQVFRDLQELISSVGDNLLGKILAAPSGEANAHLKIEYDKGTLYGLQLAMSLPARKIEEAKGLRSKGTDSEEDLKNA
jgi:hypothetical protein